MSILRNASQDEAKEIKYSNSQSGLTAVTVQGAIDELANCVNKITEWTVVDIPIQIDTNKMSISPKLETMKGTIFKAYNYAIGKESNLTICVGDKYTSGGLLLVDFHWVSTGTKYQYGYLEFGLHGCQPNNQ